MDCWSLADWITHVCSLARLVRRPTRVFVCLGFARGQEDQNAKRLHESTLCHRGQLPSGRLPNMTDVLICCLDKRQLKKMSVILTIIIFAVQLEEYWHQEKRNIWFKLLIPHVILWAFCSFAAQSALWAVRVLCRLFDIYCSYETLIRGLTFTVYSSGFLSQPTSAAASPANNTFHTLPLSFAFFHSCSLSFMSATHLAPV